MEDTILKTLALIKFSRMLSIMVGSLLCASAHAATESGWCLEQRSKVSGEHQIYLSLTRIRSVNKGSHITMYTGAPAWKLVIVNDISKTYWITDVEHLLGEPSARVFTGHRLV